jgi:hypothetical protein
VLELLEAERARPPPAQIHRLIDYAAAQDLAPADLPPLVHLICPRADT